MPPPASPLPLWRVYLIFLIPMVISNVLQGMSGTLNGIFIGQLLGTHALASVAGMFPIMFFFISLIIGLGAGASVLVGQAWGAQQPDKVRHITGAALSLGALIGVVAACLGLLFTRSAMQALGTPEDVLEDATRYAQWMMLVMPLILLFILFTQLLRGVSDTVSPMLALAISTLVSLVLTPAFIQGWMGLPQLGLLSAAAASFVSMVAAMSFLMLRLNRLGHVMAINRQMLGALRLDKTILRQVLRIGLPTGIQMVVISISELIVLRLVNQHGSEATAAYGAVTQVINYIQFPAISIAITASILAAQAIGANALQRLPLILKTGLWLNVALTGSLIALGYLGSYLLLGLFLTDAQVLAQAQGLLHLMLWSLLIFGFQAVIGGIMRASGVVLVPTLITIACIVIVQLGVATQLNHTLGLPGIWLGFPIAYLVMLSLQTAYYRLVWRHKEIRRLV